MMVPHFITDDKGNEITATPDQARLYRTGWRIVEMKRFGNRRIIKWLDPVESKTWPQGSAIRILNARKQQ